MEPRVNPMDGRVLERNYDYAQRNVRLLSAWYDCDLERMVQLLATHDIELSRNDERQFGTYYRSLRRWTGRDGG
jgi:predicted amidophosphoribosyltransferase